MRFVAATECAASVRYVAAADETSSCQSSVILLFQTKCYWVWYNITLINIDERSVVLSVLPRTVTEAYNYQKSVRCTQTVAVAGEVYTPIAITRHRKLRRHRGFTAITEKPRIV